MKLGQLKAYGHWPTLWAATLYYDVSLMAWTVLGALGGVISTTLKLTTDQKFLMVATPTLAGAVLRIALGLLADRIGTKLTGILAQLTVMGALAVAWRFGLPSLPAALVLGVLLGVAGASFAVVLPQAGRWYPPQMQGFVLGMVGAGNLGVVIDLVLAPRFALAWGSQSVFGFILLPLVVVFGLYVVFSKEPPERVKPKRLADYWNLLRERDAYWFCFFYTVSFGGFVGLATIFAIYFRDQFALSPVAAGEVAALCTFVGAIGRPLGGALADRLGGIRSLSIFYGTAAIALALAARLHGLWPCAAGFFFASSAFGMGNGAVFQLLPQRFAKDLGVMTGLVGCGGGLGGFALGMALGWSKKFTDRYTTGLLLFSGLCLIALIGLGRVKSRWRSTWGATAAARI
jgi:NNP family nitrate/nitrite transporter-like MFS transporter